MTDPQAYIGALVTAFVPDDARSITLGYTQVRFFFAPSETGTYAQAGSAPLVAGQRDYSFNKEDSIETDWWQWCLWGSGPTEGPRSEPMPVGPLRCTRRTIRQGVGRRLRLMELATVTTALAPDVVHCDSLIDPDASPSKYANRYARAIVGNVEGHTRRVRNAANNGYIPATGSLTVGQDFPDVPGGSTILELWRPVRDDDTGRLIDECMQRVAHRMWWEESFFFSTDQGVSDYAMPASMLIGSIGSVEVATQDYPQSPGWRPVGWWNLTLDLQQPMLMLLANGIDTTPYSSNQVVRVVFNRFGDRMDDDDDYWRVNQEWAIAETALEFTKLANTPGGGREDTADAATAKRELEEEVQTLRQIYMPKARGHLRTAR